MEAVKSIRHFLKEDTEKELDEFNLDMLFKRRNGLKEKGKNHGKRIGFGLRRVFKRGACSTSHRDESVV